jgi:hypothetical protein
MTNKTSVRAAQAARTAARVTIDQTAQTGPSGAEQGAAPRQSTPPPGSSLNLGANPQATAAGSGDLRQRRAELPAVAAAHDPEAGEGAAIAQPAQGAAPQAPQDHPMRDAWLPIAGQTMSLAGATALLGYGCANKTMVNGGEIETGPLLAALATGFGSLLGSGGLVAAARAQITGVRRHANANPPIRWFNAVAWLAAGVGFAATASSVIPLQEKNRRFEMNDRLAMPDQPYPQMDQYQVLSPTMNPETFGGIRDFIYYGGEDELESVKNNTQKAYFNFMSNPKIKQALGKPTDLDVKYSKIEYSDSRRVKVSPNLDTEGKQGRLTYNLAGIWSTATGQKSVYSKEVPVNDRYSFEIPRADRALFSQLAAYELRLETHAALVIKDRNPDFLKGHNKNSSKSDNGYSSGDDLSRESVTEIFANLIANDSFDEKPPEVPKSRSGESSHDNSYSYTQERQMGKALNTVGKGRNYYDDPYYTDSVCQDKPCQDGDGKSKNLQSLLKDYFASHKQLVYTAYLGKASDSETKKANAKMEAVLSRLSLPTQRPEPTQTPEHTPTTEEPTSVATSSPEPV